MKEARNARPELHFATRAIHHGYDPAAHQGAVTPPVFMTSTYAFESTADFEAVFSGDSDRCVYGRQQNPTQQLLETRLAALEGGQAALVTASGMGAIASTLLTLLSAGDEIAVHHTIYNTASALMNEGLPRFGIKVVRGDLSTPQGTAAAIGPSTRLVYFETPINPSAEVLDIARISAAAQQVGARVIVDSTFASPALQRPLELGADLVIHSLTKYLNGHGDVLGGAVIGDRETIEAIRAAGTKYLTGATPSPMSCFLVLRGLKTLELRVERHSESALKVAKFLREHAAVADVFYPGLAGTAGAEIAQRQQAAGGGLVAFELKGGLAAGRRLLNSLKLARIAVSLGDPETLIQHPATMTHASYTAEDREKYGLSEGLLRLSVGLETAADILADLKQGLDQAGN